MELFFDWLINNYIEVFGFISGLIYLYFSIKQNILLWPLGIITSALYIYVFFESKFYADMTLNGYYLIISIYGWYFWKFGKNNGKNKADLKVTRSSGVYWIFYIIISIVLFIIIAEALKRFTDSELPYWDSFTTSASIVATWMLARKKVEHWLFWIVIDLISTGLYIYKSLYPTVILFTIYTIMSVVGYNQWKKELNT